HDKSALTGRTMKQIADSRDAIWQSNRPPVDVGIDLDALPRAQAGFIEPMQARLVETLPAHDDGWEYEAKFDGYRAMVVKSDRVSLLSRRNNPMTADFPEVVEAFRPLDPDTVIDGELIANGKSGLPEFNLLQNHARNRKGVQFYAFDLPVYRGRSLMGVPLEKRRQLLKAVLRGIADPVKFSDTFEENPEKLLRAAQQFGLEGVVAKRTDSLYEPGKRSGAWIKFKLKLDQELVIGGYLPAPKRHFDALLVGYYRGGQLIFAGKIRNGFKAPGSKEAVF